MKNFTLLAIFTIGLVSMNYSQLKSSDTITETSVVIKKSIIFDLDGVLCTTNSLQAFQAIGITTTLEYIATQWKLPSQKELFDTLATAPAIRCDDAYNQGLRMPNIMVDWQCAAQDLSIIQKTMIDHIIESDKNKIEKELLINTVLMMTHPETFISTRQTIPTAINLLQELKNQGYKLYILSNWDKTSFPIFIEKFPELFTYKDQPMFDGIMISGDTELLKPDQSMFKRCLNEFNLTVHDTIFVDDTIENVQAAQQHGITSIHCENKDIQNVMKQLMEILKD